MKITFVNPNYNEPLILKFLGLPSIPIGLAYVVAATEKAGYKDITVIDAFGYKLTTEKTLKQIKESKPDITAITAVTSNVEIAKEIARAAGQFSTEFLQICFQRTLYA